MTTNTTNTTILPLYHNQTTIPHYHHYHTTILPLPLFTQPSLHTYHHNHCYTHSISPLPSRRMLQQLKNNISKQYLTDEVRRKFLDAGRKILVGLQFETAQFLDADYQILQQNVVDKNDPRCRFSKGANPVEVLSLHRGDVTLFQADRFIHAGAI